MIDEERQRHSGGSIRIPASWCRVYGFSHRSGGCRWIRGQTRSAPIPQLFSKVSSPRRSKTPRWLTALAGYDSGDPLSLDQRIDLIGALRCSVKGLRIAYNPNMNVFPVDPDVAECRLLAAAKRTTPCLARARCASDSSRGACLRALRSDLCE